MTIFRLAPRPADGSFAALSRLCAIVALTTFFALGAGAGARDAHAAQAAPTQDFYFNFSATLTGGAISGSGILEAEPQSPGVWLVTDATGVLNFYPPIPVYPPVPIYPPDPFRLLPPNGFPPTPFVPNDNLLILNGAAAQLTSGGISFAVGDGLGNLNIADGNYSFTTDFAGSGTGSFFATPGPTPGTGVLGLAFLILAGVAARARGLLAR
jgi:hypothetical protein